MDIRIVIMVFTLCMPLGVLAQQEAPSADQESSAVEKPEEVIVTGRRVRFQLRLQMLDAEKNAYEIFNQFNDEKRFEISCSISERIGTRFNEQVCQPAFKREALANEGRAYMEAYRAYIDAVKGGGNNAVGTGDIAQQDYSPPALSMPSASMIAAQVADYQRKMKQVAEEHPEFLDALIKYSEVKNEYESATSMADE